MQEIKKYLLAVSLVMLSYTAYSQDARTASLRWSSAQSVDLKSNTTLQISFQIETSEDEIRITTGNQTKVFSITSITGQWTDVTSDGSLSYQLMFGQKSGTGELKRENGTLHFTLDFSSHSDGIRQKFILSGFQQIP